MTDNDNPDDAHPSLMDMFINSTDTLQKRQINQKMPNTWNDRPPLFQIVPPQRRRFWGRAQSLEEKAAPTEEEDPNLLKGVSTVML
jgi:hypothetical protein